MEEKGVNNIMFIPKRKRGRPRKNMEPYKDKGANGMDVIEKETVREEKKLVDEKTQIVTMLDYTVDRLAIPPNIERDPNLVYSWAAKDFSFPFKAAEGWKPVEGCSEYHDLKLMSRARNLHERAEAINEQKCRRLEGSIDEGLYRAAEDAGRAVGLTAEDVISKVRSFAPTQRAGEHSPKSWPVGIDLKK